MAMELNIKQIQSTIGWSYPTAFRWAQKYGRMNEDGRWVVPADRVESVIVSRESQVATARYNFNNIVGELYPFV